MPPKPYYYDTLRQLYWVENDRKGWIQINQHSLKLHLKLDGYQCYSGGPLEKRTREIQLENDVAYAGPLAGYHAGLVEQCGYRVLVTTSPKLIKPEEGGCPLILQLLLNLFGHEQLKHVLGWLKMAEESLRTGNFRPGQALVMVGPAKSGKSLFQNLLTLLLGGRSAKPYKYMSGQTTFNGDLFTAEHLMIEDEVSSTNAAKRHHFGTEIKGVTVNETQACHPKNKQIIMLVPFWRLSISTNEDNLTILPPMNDDLVDKFIITKVEKLPMPMPTVTMEERKVFWDGLVAELPAFVNYLQKWQVPKELECERFGILSFGHPDLMADLNELAPETRLLAIIDSSLFHKESVFSGGWKGTSDKLENFLRASSYAREAELLLNFQNAIGVYLGRLAAKHPERFSQKRDAAKRVWTIKAAK
jgi:hypothetical protein